MYINRFIWLIVFGLLVLGIFWFLRGNLHPNGYAGPHNNDETYKNYRKYGLIILLVAFSITVWLYTQEPKVHIYTAE